MHRLIFSKATSVYSLGVVLGVINKYSGLISEKPFYQMKEATYFILVDKDSEEPVGVTGYRELNSWCVEQINTVIIPEFRGKGYGREASTRLCRWLLDKKGYGKVFCTVNTTNHKMVSIKTVDGFSIEGILRNHFSSNRDVFVLSKFGKMNDRF